MSTIVCGFDPTQYKSPQRVWDAKKRQYTDEWETPDKCELYLCDGRKIVVPKGFRYDKGSVPRWAWWLIPRDDRTGINAFKIHDYLYDAAQGRPLTRSEADQVMYELLRMGGMSWLRAQAAHKAVRMAVWKNW